MDPHDNLLAERLNTEPILFRGCTFSELGVSLARGWLLPYRGQAA